MPVTKFDEFPIQQLETTFDHVEDSDRRWYERYWFCVHDPAGETALVHGLGVYPNANLMDGFASVVHGGVQRNVRCSRMLDHERMDTFLGPLSVTVVEGLRTVRISLGENEQDVSYELELEADGPPLDRTRLPFLRLPDGRLHQRASMFAQTGRASGTLRIGGEEIRVESWPYAKTNSWGIRSHAGGPDGGPAPFLAARIGERRICLVEGSGEIVGPDGAPTAVERVEWEVDGDRVLALAPGLRLEAIRRATVHLDGGFGAHADFFDGLYRGDEAYDPAGRVTTDRLDLADEAALARIRGRDDHVVVLEADGETGIGVLELGVRGGADYLPPLAR
jgi:hypothetical protein